MMTRRFLLAAAAVTAGALALPPTFAAEAAALPHPLPSPPPMPAWCVGTPDAFDWRVIRAQTRDEAVLLWRQDESGMASCGCSPDEERECEFCGTADTEAVRTPSIDTIAEPTRGDWIRAGLGAYCARCDNETFAECGGHGVGDDAVCEDCMTPEDWQIADPERYAQMLADAAEDAS